MTAFINLTFNIFDKSKQKKKKNNNKTIHVQHNTLRTLHSVHNS